MVDPLETDELPVAPDHGRQRFILDDTGFDEVPKKYRKFYRKWKGAGDSLAPKGSSGSWLRGRGFLRFQLKLLPGLV